jgi:hypothetical protein
MINNVSNLGLALGTVATTDWKTEFTLTPPVICGDGVCEMDETCQTCQDDCGPCSICGNGICGAEEDEANCFQDCDIAEVFDTITTSTARITVFAQDTAEEDGDRVAILLNGTVVRSDITLTNAGESFDLTLIPGRNVVDIKALNTGDLWPNTAGFTVTNDNGTQLLRADWEMETDQISRLIVIYNDDGSDGGGGGGGGGGATSYPESSHPYSNNHDEEWVYTLPGSHASIDVTFDSQTDTESCCDFIHVKDGSGNDIPGSPFVGSELAGQTVNVPGTTVRIQLTTDGSVTYWGFRVTRVIDGGSGGGGTGLPESPHPYSNNYDQEWTYTLSGSQASIDVTFDGQTQTESCCDRIYITDASGNEISGSPFAGTELAGQTVNVPGATVRIRLTTDGSITYWGFRVTNLTDGG